MSQNKLIEAIQAEQSKKTEEINKIEFGRLLVEIRHNKVYLVRIENDYVPKKAMKVVDRVG